ncbi:hypothetical protein MJ390_19070 [Klebsiella pneumoniae]|nr:hypothetical protein MJ390_19070 [Klebsiella pneumoniae]
MTGLLIMALLFGFGGSIVSLMMSKWDGAEVSGWGSGIEQPRNETERWLDEYRCAAGAAGRYCHAAGSYLSRA